LRRTPSPQKQPAMQSSASQRMHSKQTFESQDAPLVNNSGPKLTRKDAPRATRAVLSRPSLPPPPPLRSPPPTLHASLPQRETTPPSIVNIEKPSPSALANSTPDNQAEST
jgi:hypothetical protein